MRCLERTIVDALANDSDLVAEALGFGMRHRQRERLGELGDRAPKPLFAILEREDVIHRPAQPP